MFENFGGLFGWLLVWAFVGTILNYCVKFVNKKFGKKISANPVGKQIMKALLTIFVRNHKYFGYATGVFLLAHSIIQFTRFGLNLTGFIAGIIMIFQVGLGIYGGVKKLPRKGAWFVTHRVLAALLILGVAIHIIFPYALNIGGGEDTSHTVSENVDVSELPTFTLEELSENNGVNGNKAYVAYKGFVYDVTDVPQWKTGEHNGQTAGTDLTELISRTPHGDSVFENLKIVGKLN